VTPKHELIVMLERLHAADDRAAFAALRRGLNPGAEATVYPYVAPFFPRDPSPRVERAYVLVAGLFALHPSSGGVTIGHALRRIRDAAGSGSIEQRFVALLDAPAEDLGEHLRHAVMLARSKEIPLDWNDLLRAVLAWDYDDRRPQRRWAHDFWNNAAEEEGTSP
jgi:CRISPR system Cascade subunit CasB